MSTCKYYGDRTCERMHECDGCAYKEEWEKTFQREFRRRTLTMKAGIVQQMFDTAMYDLGRICLTMKDEEYGENERDQIDEMIASLNEMKNNMMAYCIFKAEEEE